MKKMVGLVIFLAVVIFGGYYVTGHIAENTIRKDVQAFNRVQGLHVEIKEYHRGFYKSEAVFKWKLHLPQHVQNASMGQTNTVPASDVQSEMPLTIYHGPLIISNKGMKLGLASASSDFGLPEPYMTQFQQVFTPDSVKPQLTLNFFINFMLKTSVDMSIPQFKATAKSDNIAINWKGLLAQTSGNSDLSTIKGDIVLEGIQVSNDKKSIDMGKLSTDYHLTRNDMGLYLGNAAFKVDDIIAKEGSNVMFELKQLIVTSNNQIENKQFSVHLNGTLDKVMGNGRTFGPAKITLNLVNLDAASLVRIRDIADNARKMGSSMQKNQAMLGILPELPKLLSHGPRFEVPVIQISTTEGVLDGNIMVSLPENSGSNVFEMIQKIQGKGHLSIPDAMIRMVLQPSIINEISAQQKALPQGTQPVVNLNADVQTRLDNKIQNMIQSGLLLKKDNAYTIDVTLDKGQFTVNGKPFSPTMLQ